MGRGKRRPAAFAAENKLPDGTARIGNAGKEIGIFGRVAGPYYNGHATGFSLENPRYAAGICRLDTVAYRLAEAVKRRPTYRDEDWLIMITSDHGGHGLRHGTQKQFDRMTFIASNKAI